jgi:hypothetical protein
VRSSRRRCAAGDYTTDISIGGIVVVGRRDNQDEMATKRVGICEGRGTGPQLLRGSYRLRNSAVDELQARPNEFGRWPRCFACRAGGGNNVCVSYLGDQGCRSTKRWKAEPNVIDMRLCCHD